MQRFNDTFNISSDKYIPLNECRKGLNKSNDWCTNKTGKLMNKREKLFKKYCCSYVVSSIHIDYKRVRNQVTKLILISKHENIPTKIKNYGLNYIHTVFCRCDFFYVKFQLISSKFLVKIGSTLDQTIEPVWTQRFLPERLEQSIYFSDNTKE